MRALSTGQDPKQRILWIGNTAGQAGKILPKTIVAMARELTAYLWAVLHPAAAPTRA